MKIHILFEFKQGAAGGGGNQFLKTLKQYLVDHGVYSEKVENADIVLFNSYQYIPEVANIKKTFPSKILLHRIDGPIRLYNNLSDKRDFVTNTANQLIADATIFQSVWSREENRKLGLKLNRFETTIMNAPDARYFNRKGKKVFSRDRKIKLIATSWSSNINKGFKIYQWLDKNLDFSKYSMVFVGNSPLKFTNIETVQPLSGEELALRLKESDIFITASQKDPCSNSLIEALHCGLPSVALKDGGHPDIIGQAGECFQLPEEIFYLLDKIVQNYNYYQSKINLPTMENVGEKYLEFMSFIFDTVQRKDYKPKRLSILKMIRVRSTIAFWKLSDRFPQLFVKKW